MSIAAKQLMLRDVEKNLGVFLTVEEVRYTMQIITEMKYVYINKSNVKTSYYKYIN